MSVYTLLKTTAAQAAIGNSQSGPGGANGDNLPAGSQVADLHVGSAAAGMAVPSQNQTFQAVVTGGGPVVGGVFQLVVSNDGRNWSNYGSAITAPSTAGVSTITTTGSAAWAYFSAIATTVTGTNPTAAVYMNA